MEYIVPDWTGPERRSRSSELERIAVLETAMERVIQGQESIIIRLNELSKELTVYKAFLNGVVWIVGGLAAMAFVLWQVFSDIHRWK